MPSRATDDRPTAATVVRVFGVLAVERGDDISPVGGPRIRRLLALLLIRPGTTSTIDELAEHVWDDADRPEDPEPALRTYISRLRRELPEQLREAVETVPGGYRWSGPPEQLEHVRFEGLRAEAAAVRETGDPARALGLLDEALARWRGRPFVDLDDIAPARAVIDGLEVDRLEAEEERFEVELELGRHTQIVGRLTTFAVEHATRDRAAGQLALALHRSGRTSDAIRALHEHRRRLQDETGLDPSTPLVELERRLLDGDPELDPPDAGVPLRGYRLLDRIGTGTFSVVWRAVQPSVGREVAVKQIRAELASQTDFVRRFEAEAHLVARIEHPHVVPLIDYWRDPDSAYLVMRWLRGGSLEERLRAGPLPLDDVVRILDEIGSALTAAHGRGVIHRDVKSANILFDEDSVSYLTDFGIAVDTTVLDPVVSALSTGSPAFASPEQQAGERFDVRTDVYSLGIVAAEALLGGPSGRGARPIESLRDRDGLPSAVVEAVIRAMSSNRDDRFPTVQSFLEALHAEAPTTHARPPGPNPYRGLLPFEEADAERFFGRDRLVHELVGAVERGRVVVLVGPSGSGKSSVVRAGLLPELRSGGVPGADRWFVATMTPGADPFAALATALEAVATRRDERIARILRSGDNGIVAARAACGLDGGQTVLVVVDQLEELHTTADPADAHKFLAAVATAASTPDSGVRVVATLRADQYHRPLAHPTFAEHLKDGAVEVTPLQPEELERVVVDPATEAGVSFEPGLVARIVADAHGRPAVLPLLQHLLRELYERRIGSTIHASAYDELGGVGGALAATAERLYRDADAAQQEATRRVFGALVASSSGDDLRRRVPVADLRTDRSAGSVVDHYAAARLLTLDRDPVSREPTVEVTHEALLRSWPRLAGWLADDRELLSHVRALQAAADRWDEGARSPADLLRGVRLQAGSELVDDASDRLRPVDHELVVASVQAAETQATEEARRATRLRRLVTVTGGALVVALVAAAVALGQRNRADEQAAAAERAAAEAGAEAERAEQAAAAADVQTLISRSAALADDDPALSILLALEAHRRAPSSDTEGAVLSSLVAVGPLLSVHEPLVAPGEDCDSDGVLSPDGRAQYATLDGRMVVHDIRTETNEDVGAHPDGCGHWEASSGGDRFMATSRSLDRFRFGTIDEEGVDMTADLFVPEAATGVGFAYDLATGRRLWLDTGNAFAIEGRIIDTSTGTAVGAPIGGLVKPGRAFSPDGSLLAVSSGTLDQPDGGGPLHLVDTETGTIRWTVPLAVRAIAFAFDLESGHLLAGTLGGRVVTLALADGTVVADVRSGGATDLISLSLRDDGLVLATTQGELSLVDRFAGPRGTSLPLRNAVTGIASSDGTVVVHDHDHRNFIYDLDGGAIVENAFPIPRQASVRYMDPYLAAIDIADATVDRIELETGERATFDLRSPDGAPFSAIAVSPQEDGSFLTFSTDLTVARWVEGELVDSTAPDIGPGSALAAGSGYSGHVALVEVTAEGTSSIHRYQVRDDGVRLVGTVPLDVRAAATFPTGSSGLHVLTFDGEFRTYGDSGELVRRFHAGPRSPQQWLGAHPDGRRLVFGGPAGLLVVDPESERSRLIEDAGDVVNVSLAPDGLHAVVGTRDGVYRLWDLEEARPIGVVYDGNSSSLGPPGIEEDGRYAWLSTPGRAIRVPIEPAAWIERACAVVDRELTGAEWDEHVPGDLERTPACS